MSAAGIAQEASLTDSKPSEASQSESSSAVRPEQESLTEARFRSGAILTLALGHGTADFYPGFLASVLPYLITKLSLSLTLAGSLVSLESMATSLIQPVLGYIADARRPRPWAAWGVAMAAILFSLVGLAPSVPALAALIILGGLGVALYHPQGASMTTALSRGRAGTAMSFFATGGSIGYALGPLVAVFIIEGWNLESLAILALPGIAVAVLIHRVLQRPLAEQARSRSHISLRASLAGIGSRLAWLLATMTLRSAILSGISTMLPIYLEAKGLSLVLGSTSVFILRLAGGVGVFFGGPFSDRFGRKAVLVASFAFTLPFLYMFFHSEGIARMAYLAVASAILTSSTPVNTVMAQEVTPKMAGIASGLMMGVGWALGSLSIAIIGFFADRSGIEAVLPVAVLSLLLVGLLLATLIPYKQKR